MNLLDIRTILFSYTLTNAISAFVMTSLWRQNRRRSPELVFWLIDFIMQFVGILLLSLRGVLPDFLDSHTSEHPARRRHAAPVSRSGALHTL